MLELVLVTRIGLYHLEHFFAVLRRDCESELEEGEVVGIGRGAHGSKQLYRYCKQCLILILKLNFLKGMNKFVLG